MILATVLRVVVATLQVSADQAPLRRVIRAGPAVVGPVATATGRELAAACSLRTGRTRRRGPSRTAGGRGAGGVPRAPATHEPESLDATKLLMRLRFASLKVSHAQMELRMTVAAPEDVPK